VIGLALLSGFTYWAPLPTRPVDVANIQPRDLGDMSRFYPAATRSTLMSTGRAIAVDQWLTVPPHPIPINSGTPPLALAGTVPPFMATRGVEPLSVEVYGLAERLSTVLPMPDVQRTGTLLAGTVVTSGTFELRIPITPETRSIAIRCSRTVVLATVVPGSPDMRPVCFQVDYLAAPNEGDRFVVPGHMPEEVLTRSALGTTRIDARHQAPGHYLLPTFYYPFLRVTAADGASVPVYHFDRRAAIRHMAGVDQYTVSYGLEPELIGFLTGLVVIGTYALIASRLRRWAPTWRWPTLDRRPHSIPSATAVHE
jgi:hypothetical protein